MKIKLLIAVLALLATGTIAQNSPDQISTLKLDTPCATEKRVAQALAQFKEKPMLRMSSERTTIYGKGNNILIMFVNPETQSYTMIEKLSEDVFCVISVGNGVAPYIPNAEPSS